MKKVNLHIVFPAMAFFWQAAQATFSIAAVDLASKEVGSAGGSCVDYVGSNLVAGRIGDVLPGKGAINTQASYDARNQANARTRMLAGDSPAQIIEWLKRNDVTGNNTIRQYGVVDLNRGNPRSAAHSGTRNQAYNGHILGPNYSIQGNILSGRSVLSDMESRFQAENGSLACKLMAALQGAKRSGADTRCATNGTSTLYSYIKVAKPTDELDKPSLFLSVRTRNRARIEPVDSLQTLFDKRVNCKPIGIGSKSMNFAPTARFKTNHTVLHIQCIQCPSAAGTIRVLYLNGKTNWEGDWENNLELAASKWPRGLYIIQIQAAGWNWTQKVLKH